MGGHVVERCGAPSLLFDINRLREVCQAFIDPGPEGMERSMGKLMRGREPRFGSGFVQVRQQERSALEGCVVCLRQVGCDCLLLCHSEPVSYERLNLLGSGGVCRSGGGVILQIENG